MMQISMFPLQNSELRTSIRPKDHIIIGGVTPTLKEIEKQMLGPNIDVSSVRTD